MTRPMLGMIVLAGLAACSSAKDGPAPFEATNSAEELSVVPAAPLVIPSVLNLPQPDPGGVNRADSSPFRRDFAPE